MEKKIIVEFYHLDQDFHADIEIPVDITALELYQGLASAYGLKNDSFDMSSGYLKSENPIALLKGDKTLKEYGIHDGSRIIYTERG